MLSKNGAASIQLHRPFKERLTREEQERTGIKPFISEDKIDQIFSKDPYLNVEATVTGKGGSSALEELRAKLREEREAVMMEEYVGPLVKKHNHEHSKFNPHLMIVESHEHESPAKKKE